MHGTGLRNLKPENVSSNCRDIIVSMLWEMKFYFQLLCVHVLRFWVKKLGGARVPPAPPRATALLLLFPWPFRARP